VLDAFGRGRAANYLTASLLETLWVEIGAAFRSQLAESNTSVQELLQRGNPAVAHFNLAENRRDDEAPFAVLATCTIELSATAQHLRLAVCRAKTLGLSVTNHGTGLKFTISGPVFVWLRGWR
jgi:hypothetical protein